MGLNGQKTEKDQGMGEAGQFFAPHVGLAQNVCDQNADALFDPVQLEFGGALNRHHQAIQSSDPQEEKGKGSDQGHKHDKRFDDGVRFH